MFLCDEYSKRKNINISPIKFIKKGFVFFGKNNYLLVIKWINEGVGFYEISECILEKKIKTLKLNNVNWEDYETFIKEWSLCNSIITDKKTIFNLTWEYYIRRNQDFFIQNYGPLYIFPTIDEKNKNRIFDSIVLLEKLQLENKTIFDLWNDKISEIINFYCHWIAEVK